MFLIRIKNVFFLVIMTFLFFTNSSLFAHEKKWPEKRLRQVWPEALKFTSKQLSLSPLQLSELNAAGIKMGSEDRSPTFYFAQGKETNSEKSKTIGIILFIDEYGANGRMEISIGMGDDGKIKKIDLWEHSENKLIEKEDFIKQFIGKSIKESLDENKDYIPLKEAIQASRAIAHAAYKALKITNLIFEKKEVK